MKRRIVLPEVPEVKLPVLFSMRPGLYLLILYSIVILVAVFCIAYLPGILKGGRYVTFQAPLFATGIVVDGTYLGSADNQYFVGSGEHEVAYMKGGIPYAKAIIDVDHPVFLTWLAHRTMTIPSPPLSVDDTQKALIIRYGLAQIQAASAILSYDDVTRYEPVYANLISDLQALEVSESMRESALELALLYITNETMFSDAQASLAVSKFEKTEFMQTLLNLSESLFSGTASSTGQLQKTLQGKKQQTSLFSDAFSIPGFTYAPVSFIMGSRTDMNYPAINEAGTEASTPQFSLSTYEISQYQWALFLEENPMWEKANLSSLMQQGLVDEAYLAGISPSVMFVTNKPIHNISFYAAQAFCDWLSKKTQKSVFLPTESMWTAAALSHSDLKFDASLSPIPTQLKEPVSLLGGVWELTQTTHIPLARISDYRKAQDLHQSFGLPVQPIVKGGSYVNDAKSISSNTVGVVDPDACGDLIGFRIAWYE